MDNSHDDSYPKKAITKKRMVDLKAVAALLDDQEEKQQDNVWPLKQINGLSLSAYKLDEELIQETTRIKSQRDLILERINKMNRNRSQVSKNVFEKVQRDYSVQLDNINKLLKAKKDILNRELENLYLLREKQTVEINRHKEILEEARFRHYLEEFSEEQYKEVESFETREIENFQSVLSQTQSFIRVHEELFDPKDLGLSSPVAEKPSIDSSVTKTIPKSRVETSSQPLRQSAATPPTAQFKASSTIDELSEKTPTPIKAEKPPIEKQDVTEDPDSITETDKESYFETTDPCIGLEARNKIENRSSSPTPLKEKVEKTPSVHSSKEPESIFDVLEDVPLESESSETASRASDKTPSPLTSQLPTTPESTTLYKLVFTEVEEELDIHEFPLKDNISIGRSPSNDLVLNASKVSRQHAAINKYKDQYLVIDLKSSNGVFVNGKKIDEHALQEGDEVSIGGYKMIFKKA